MFKQILLLSFICFSSLGHSAETKPSTSTETPATTNDTSPANASQTKEEHQEKTETPTAKTDESRKWRIGPTVNVSFPRIRELALEYKSGNGFFSAAAISGGFSLKPESKIEATFSNYEIRGRLHPFAGSFFLGLGLGTQSIKIKATDSISSTNVDLNLDIASTYMVPHIGWLTVYSFGLTFGFDIGTVIPSGVKSTVTSNANSTIQAQSEYQKLKSDAQSAGDKLGKTSLPYVTLLKVGWLF